MKNRKVTNMLCITLISSMVMSSTVGVSASAEVTPEAEPEVTVGAEEIVEPDVSEEIPSEEEITPDPTEPVTPDPTDTPDPVPTETPDPTGTPDPTDTPDPTVTPDPTDTPEPTVTPDPTDTPEPTVTPDPTDVPENPVDKAAVNDVINMIDGLNKGDKLTKEQLEEVREAYEKLTPEERALVNNYGILIAAEDKLNEDDKQIIDVEPNEGSESEGSTGYVAEEGSVVTYSGGISVSNLHAGRSFYLDQLKDTYALEFDDEFEDVMDSIEKDYKEKNKISDDTEILVRNWQDVLAIHVLKQQQAGEKIVTLDKTSKQSLAEIFEELNPVVRDKKNILLVSYKNLHVSDYVSSHKGELDKKERALLNKYTSKDCALLCATVTAAKGFIRQSAGDEISEERVNVISAGFSLVGKVGYFWGGKSRVIGWDSSWGTAATVDAEGSKSSGTMRAYGLDCSGFVTWAFVNGYQDAEMGDAIGDGTSDQWGHCVTINAQDAQPGDLVFQRGPEGGSSNHVGILVGQTEEGDWIAVHCSSGQNGVTVGEAYSASFRYIRCPSVYPTREEVLAQREAKEQELMEQSLAIAPINEKKEPAKKKSLTDDIVVQSIQEKVAIEE